PVVESVPVRELWHPGYGREHPLMRRLLDAAECRGVVVRTARELLGRHHLGDVTLEVLAPAPSDGAAYYEELHANDNSLVLRLRYGDDTALWRGDIGRWGERYRLASGADVSADVVKAGHHGSRTSSTPPFVRATGAEHVLFTTGRDNQWGFPHDDVVERWRASGARLWDTGRHGEITFRLTGHGVIAQGHRDDAWVGGAMDSATDSARDSGTGRGSSPR